MWTRRVLFGPVEKRPPTPRHLKLTAAGNDWLSYTAPFCQITLHVSNVSGVSIKPWGNLSIEPWLVKVQSPFNSFPSKRSLTEPLKKTALYEHLWFVHYPVYLNPRYLSGDYNWDQLYFCYSFTFKNSSFSLLSCIDTLAKNKEMSRIEKHRNREMSRIFNFINQVLPQPLAVQQILKKHSSFSEA